MMQTSDERRTFFRVDDNLSLEFRQISSEEFAQLRDINRHESAPIREKIGEIYTAEGHGPRSGHDEITLYMQIINKKLDTIIDLLSQSQGGPHYHNVRTKISISGAGAQFDSDIIFQEGDYAELKIAIPVFPYPKIWSLCEVVRTQPIEGGPAIRQRIALKFIVIDERDRDIIVNYVFMKEREHLRKKKEVEN